MLKDIGGARPARVPVVYHGTVPDLFKTGRDIVVEGTLRNGVFVAKRGSLITKCPSQYTPAKSPKTLDGCRSGAPRSSSPSASSLYALVAGSYAAWKRRRRLALSAQNALSPPSRRRSSRPLVLLVALARRDFTFVYVAQHTSRNAAARLRALRVLGRPGGLAAALAARPHRLRARSPSGSTAARAS